MLAKGVSSHCVQPKVSCKARVVQVSVCSLGWGVARHKTPTRLLPDFRACCFYAAAVGVRSCKSMHKYL